MKKLDIEWFKKVLNSIINSESAGEMFGTAIDALEVIKEKENNND